MKETFIDGDKTILKTDYYLYLLQLETNWKELKKWLEEMIDWTTTKAHLKEEYDNNYTVEQKNMWWVVQQRKETLDKMQELENKDVNNK